MQRFIAGIDRDHAWLFSERLDDDVSDDSPFLPLMRSSILLRLTSLPQSGQQHRVATQQKYCAAINE